MAVMIAMPSRSWMPSAGARIRGGALGPLMTRGGLRWRNPEEAPILLDRRSRHLVIGIIGGLEPVEAQRRQHRGIANGDEGAGDRVLDPRGEIDARDPRLRHR